METTIQTVILYFVAILLIVNALINVGNNFFWVWIANSLLFVMLGIALAK